MTMTQNNNETKNSVAVTNYESITILTNNNTRISSGMSNNGQAANNDDDEEYDINNKSHDRQEGEPLLSKIDKQHQQVQSQSPQNNNNIDDNDNQQHQTYQFFLFLCISTALRSFEAGIISSMMPEIVESLDIDYTQEGTIAASPDYGIAPGALLSILIYRCIQNPRRVLLVVMIGTSTVALVCSFFPSYTTLVLARSIGGFFWAMAAVHYPVWIDQHGSPASQRTLWLAIVNVSLLGGILAGYLVGGLAASTSSSNSTTSNTSSTSSTFFDYEDINITWIHLYFLEGIFMAVCAILLQTCFDDELVQVGMSSSTTQQQENQLDGGEASSLSSPSSSMKDIMVSLITSVPFVLAVAITACISGGVVFALYFITQVCVERGLQTNETILVVAVVFVLAPGPGMITGSWAVAKLGGYIDHTVTFGVALISSIFVQISTIMFVLSSTTTSSSPSISIMHYDINKDMLFIVACWIFFFAGGMSGPPLNGIAVSTVPEASHVASGLQFSLANAAKILVPQLGGFICNRIGLINGFNYTLVGFCSIFVLLAAAGLFHSTKQQRRQRPLGVDGNTGISHESSSSSCSPILQ